MPKSHAFRTEPWAAFSRQSDHIFEENFVGNKIFIFKTSQQPLRGVFKFKQMIEKKNDSYQLDQQLKFWFPFGTQGSSIFTEINKAEVKIRYDHGLRSYNNYLLNFYSCFHVDRSLRNYVAKIGTNIVGVNTSLDNRARLMYKQTGKFQIASDHKFNWINDKWSLDFFNSLNYSTGTLRKNSFRFIYFINKNSQFFFKIDNQNERIIKNLNFTHLDTYFTNLTLDYVRRLDKSTKIGLQSTFANKSFNNASVVVQKQINNQKSKVKAKISSNQTISLSLQSRIANYGRWVVGWEISDLGRQNHSKYGLLVDLNL